MADTIRKRRRPHTRSLGEPATDEGADSVTPRSPKRPHRCGRVIQIGGGLGTQPAAIPPHYASTLAARHNLAVSLAGDLRGSGVASKVVAPGAIAIAAVQDVFTEMAADHGLAHKWEDIERAVVREPVSNDIERLGRPIEVAAAVAYLCGTYADYISGPPFESTAAQ